VKYSIIWQPLAIESFYEELDFILLKWNPKEAEKFSILVEDSLFRIRSKPEIGKFNSKKEIYSLVLSKQTTLIYKIIENADQIDLLLFWNNKKNPKLLQKLL
jgi:plasmid stabilization system protein ParE